MPVLSREADLVGVDAGDVGLDQGLESGGPAGGTMAACARRPDGQEAAGRRATSGVHRPPLRKRSEGTTSSWDCGVAGGGSVPHAAPVGRDVDLGGVAGVGDHPVAPLEVEAADAASRSPRDRPSGRPTGRTRSRRAPSGSRGSIGHVVDVLVAGEHGLPGRAAIGASRRSRRPCRRPASRVPRPRGRGAADPSGSTARPLGPFVPVGQGEARPVLGAVGGPVERAVARRRRSPRARSGAPRRGRACRRPPGSAARRRAAAPTRPAFFGRPGLVRCRWT